MVRCRDFFRRCDALSDFMDAPPWAVTSRAEAIVADRLARDAGAAVHATQRIDPTAVVEAGAIIKGPVIIGPRCFVAAGAYLRGGVLLESDCIVGPSCEVKSTFLLTGSKIAHLSFVGDSIVGAGVNIEAGAVIANYRNERDDKRLRIVWRGATIEAEVEKFGAAIGDGARIGANAVIAPGALIEPNAVIERLSLFDQSPKD